MKGINNMVDVIPVIFDELVREIESCKGLSQQYLVSKGNDNGFENLVRDKIVKQFNLKIKELLLNNDIELIPQFGHHFPDLDLIIDKKKYGIELKSRKDGSWKTQGGSAFESTSESSYKEIYLLFASRDDKKGETSYKVRYAPYWKATEAIKVTHSPRFSINLDAESSVFTSNQDYNEFHKLTKEEKSQYIQKALAKTVTKPTWYSNPNNIITTTFFSELDKEQQDKLRVETLILFPDDLLQQPRADYHRVTKYLLSEYYVANPSTRDMFSAGGKVTIDKISFPKIIHTYRANKDAIVDTLSHNTALDEVAYDYWKWPKNKNKTTPLKDFKIILDILGKENYEESLHEKKLSEIIFNNPNG